MLSKLPKLSIVVPCYNEEAALPETLVILYDLLVDLKLMHRISDDSFLVFVDDGSSDSTYNILCLNKCVDIKIIKLSVNKGHQYALLAGLDYVKDKADCVVTIDADLQDDLMVIDQMIDRYNLGAHIVCGVRQDRGTDGFWKRKSAKLFYLIMKWMGVILIENHADFRLVSKTALDEILKYKESNLFLRGLFPLINLKIETISYVQKDRLHGRSKYSFYKMFSLALSGITSFSSVPIRIITIMGLLLFFLTLILSLNVLVTFFNGNAVPGWASITLPMYFLGGIQLFSLGVIGEYVGKIYKETKRRPLYHIEEMIE